MKPPLLVPLLLLLWGCGDGRPVSSDDAGGSGETARGAASACGCTADD